MRPKRGVKPLVKFEGWTLSEGGVDAGGDGIDACYGRLVGRFGGAPGHPSTGPAAVPACAAGEWRIPLDSRCKNFPDRAEFLRLPPPKTSPSTQPGEAELRRFRPHLKLADGGAAPSAAAATTTRSRTKSHAGSGGLGRLSTSTDDEAAEAGARRRRGVDGRVFQSAGATAVVGSGASLRQTLSWPSSAVAAGSGRVGQTPSAPSRVAERGSASQQRPLHEPPPPLLLVTQAGGRPADGQWAGGGLRTTVARGHEPCGGGGRDDDDDDDGTVSRAGERSDMFASPPLQQQPRQLDELRSHLRRSFTGMTPNLIRLVTTHIISHGKRTKDDGSGRGLHQPHDAAGVARDARADANRAQAAAPGLPGKFAASGITWALEFPDIWKGQREQTLIVRRNC